MSERRPILCLDFDGVLHAYDSGWHGVGEVEDGPTPGATAFLRDAVSLFEVHVVSTRSSNVEGILAMRDALSAWLIEDLGADVGWAVYQGIHFPTHKPACFLTIDDRATTFTGT